jgi:hypothetical protein
MSAGRQLLALAGREHGAVTVLVALILPILILPLGAFVIDVGNWIDHQRHLQLQADAGALAGAQEFTAQGCSDAVIKNRALQYSGMPVSGFTSFNQQVGPPHGALSESVNTQSYPAQPSPPASDPTPMTGSPCNDGMLDLKLTETPVPQFFHLPFLGQVLGGINAHARVSILQQTSGTGFLPFAVNETAPTAARAYFIDETASSFTPIASVALTNTGTNAQGQAVWSNTTPLPVTINKDKIGVVVALSGDKSNTTCPSNSQFVNCFDVGPGPDLVHVQGWSTGGTGTATGPIARAVTLQPGTGLIGCADAYFSNSTSDCTFGVNAKIDVGATPNPPGVTVQAVVSGTSYPLTYSSTTGTWNGTATLHSGSRSNQVDLTVTCTKGTGAPCSKTTTTTLPDVQRAYAANSTTSGTIVNAGISESATPDANSFQSCATCTHNLVVTVAVAGSLQNAQSVSDPLYVMRFGNGTSASQTGAITCNPNGSGQLRTDIAQGCSGHYTINTSDPSCTNTNPGPLGTPPPPADCVVTSNGLKTGQFRQGLADRFANQTCPNNWSSFPHIPNNDPRIVGVFITPYGSFGASGGQAYQIQNFATFYVTGWDKDPCNSDDSAGSNQLVGHFIKYINPYDPGAIGGQKCNLNSVGNCVAILTR